jgi:hypothetical protein
MNNVIFLDIDGVLNSEKLITELYNKNIKEYGNIYNFIDDDIVNKLTYFCKLYKLNIVLSSSWRYFYFDDTIKNFTKNRYRKLHSLIPYIIGQTPRLYIEKENGRYEQLCRGDEIQHYINKYHIENYVILDDDSDILDSQINHFIHVDYKYGLTNKNFKQIKNILKL